VGSLSKTIQPMGNIHLGEIKELSIEVETLTPLITEMGRENFPDEEDLNWTVDYIKKYGAYFYIKAMPENNSSGYSEYIFMLKEVIRSADVLAIYCLEDGIFNLLCTSSSCPANIGRSIME